MSETPKERPGWVEELVAEGVPEVIADPSLRCDFFAWMRRDMEEHPERYESRVEDEPLEIKFGPPQSGYKVRWLNVFTPIDEDGDDTP